VALDGVGELDVWKELPHLLQDFASLQGKVKGR